MARRGRGDFAVRRPVAVAFAARRGLHRQSGPVVLGLLDPGRSGVVGGEIPINSDTLALAHVAAAEDGRTPVGFRGSPADGWRPRSAAQLMPTTGLPRLLERLALGVSLEL